MVGKDKRAGFEPPTMNDSVVVLHVDDDADDRERVRRRLERLDADVEVLTATSGEGATATLDRESVDCVVSAYRLPGTDGLALLEAVRERDPELPFVLFTDEGSEEVASEAISAGVSDYVEKDDEGYALLATRIRRLVERHRARRQAARLDRTTTIVSRVNWALVRADSREAVERDVCSVLAGAEPYRRVWIAGVVDGTVDIHAEAGEEGWLPDLPRPTDDPELRRTVVGRALETGGSTAADDPVVDGSTADVPCRSAAAVPLVHDGRVYGVLGLCADRRDAFDDHEREVLADVAADVAYAIDSLAVRGRMERAEKAVTHAADAVFITDREGTIEYVNPAFEEVTGFSATEAVGRNPRILKSGVQGAAYYDRLWDALLDGQIWEEEVVNERADGARYHAHQTIAPITENGTIEKFVAIQRDVTEKKRLEAHLQRTALALTRLYEVAADRELELEAKLDRVLEIGADHLGFSVGYLTRIDGGVQEIVATTGDHDRVRSGRIDPIEDTYCRHTIDADEPVVIEDVHEAGMAEDPAYESFGLRCYVGASIDVDGEPYGTLCFGAERAREDPILDVQRSTVRVLAQWIGHEIERRAAARELRRQNDRLEEFVSAVSHDLRNPLDIANGYLDLIEAELADEADLGTVAEHVETVDDAVDRMVAIVEDTLTLARQGRTVDEFEELSLAAIARRSWEGVDTADASLEVPGDRGLLADGDRLRQVFENLYRNAVEHAGEGVTVVVGPTDRGFYVADDGPGIPREEREQVFEHGYTTDDGTGFGLAIVERIVDAHGWSIDVGEGDRGGARFDVVVDRDGAGERTGAPADERTRMSADGQVGASADERVETPTDERVETPADERVETSSDGPDPDESSGKKPSPDGPSTVSR